MRKIAAGTAAAAALALIAGTTTTAAAAPVRTAGDGPESLASVLLADGNTFDKNNKDFDIVTEAVLAVLGAKPKSPVGVLTDGTVALTAFIPNDLAFKHLVHSLTGKMPKTERAAFNAVAGLGIDTVESVLLYHVVPGATITKKQALKANGVKLTTALGSTVKVQVRGHGHSKIIKLSDKDYNSRNARVVKADINKDSDNVQIAHGVDRVLRPMDLPPLAH